MNESQIRNRIVSLGKRINPQMSGNLCGSRIRKGIITMQRAQDGKDVTDEHLPKQMSHSVSTAQQYYNIEEQAQSDIRVASFLSTLTSQNKEEHHEDYEGTSICFVDDRFIEPVNISHATPAADVLGADVNIDEGEEGASISFIDDQLVEVKISRPTPAAYVLGADVYIDEGDEGVSISFIHDQLVEEVKISRATPAVDDLDKKNQVQPEEEREKLTERGNQERGQEGRGKQMEKEHKNEDRHPAERGESIERGEENEELTAEQERTGKSLSKLFNSRTCPSKANL